MHQSLLFLSGYLWRYSFTSNSFWSSLFVGSLLYSTTSATPRSAMSFTILIELLSGLGKLALLVLWPRINILLKEALWNACIAEESSSVSQTESSNCFKLISAGSNVVLFSGCLMPVLSRAATIWHLVIGTNGDPVIKERKSQQFFRQIPVVTQKFLNCNLCNYTIFLLVSVNVLQDTGQFEEQMVFTVLETRLLHTALYNYS